jgi:hypothetical protein
VDKLLRNADLALYRAKHDGRCTFRTFDPCMLPRLDEVFADVTGMPPAQPAAS